MLDPRLGTAFRNAALQLRDQEGKPPSGERIAKMLEKFELIREHQPDDVSYSEAIGRGWKIC